MESATARLSSTLSFIRSSVDYRLRISRSRWWILVTSFSLNVMYC